MESGLGEREPVTLAVGALVLLGFRTDLQLEHNPGQGWKIKLRTRPRSDSAVGKILSQLFGSYLNPDTRPQLAGLPPAFAKRLGKAFLTL